MYCNIPLFTVVRNVYLDGVFDLCHLGHKKHIMRAQEYGNRVHVGVMGDADTAKYKRDPCMNIEERCAEIRALRCVYEVIPNAPCEVGSLTTEFLNSWNFHVVLCGPEYDDPTDET